MLELHIDKERFDVKPNDNTIIKIANRITEFKWKCSIREFAIWVGEEGRAFVPVLMEGERKGSNFKQQQVFSIDFDETLPLDEFWKRTELVGLYPAFVYKTFNCHENNDRYRAVYINDCIIENRDAASLITGMLLYLFPEGDQNCKDLARYYLGGKGLLHYDEDARISADGVAIALKTYLVNVYGKNYDREMIKIAKDINVAVGKGVFRILVECNKIGEESQLLSHMIYMGEYPGKLKIYYYEPYTGSKNSAPAEFYKSKRPKIIQNKSAKDIMQCCRLFEEHLKGDLHHNYKFMLALNLYHIKGGHDLFFSGLKDNKEKWKAAWKTIGENGYHPESCGKGKCPYADECKCRSLYEKLQRRIKIKGKEQFITLEEGTKLLSQYMKEAVSSNNKDLFLIKAQTAIGKTYTYCKMVETRSKNEKPLLIAAPTNDLQKEIHTKIKRIDDTAKCTYNLVNELERLGFSDISIDSKDLYKKGFGKKVKKHVSSELKKLSMNPAMAARLEEVLGSKELFDGETHIVTTHAMLLNLPQKILNQYEIIVDEDILLTIFNGTETISFNDLDMSSKSKALSVTNKERIEKIMESEDDVVGYTGLNKMNDFELEMFSKEGLPIESSLPGFLESSTYHVDKTMKMITYFTARELPRVPMTIVSATLNMQLYKDYFCGRKIEVREVPLIKYQGNLIQYTNYSVSRQFISDNTWEKVKRSVDKITGDSDMNLITFKSYAGNRKIYFGKTAGFNVYEGRDVCVIGTPHNVPFIYRLIGKHMQYVVDEVMSVRKVENEIYEYSIMTFGNVKMRNLQLYFLESELEQAVGRARLLRCNCTVYLFSNYPLRQAEIIQEDYLNVEDVE